MIDDKPKATPTKMIYKKVGWENVLFKLMVHFHYHHVVIMLAIIVVILIWLTLVNIITTLIKWMTS